MISLLGVSALICGVTSLVFWQLRQPLTNRVGTWSWKTRTKFVVLGGIGALWGEFVFWAFEKVFNASGVAASPSLLLDWLVTMPWY
jgi:H+/Cl- antiporter ClcA